jgi:hypothetical protein
MDSGGGGGSRLRSLGRFLMSLEIRFAALPLFHFVDLFAHIVFTFNPQFSWVSRTMTTRALAFNLYLVLAVLFGAGCQTTEERQRKKEATTFRLHLSTRPDGTHRTGAVPIGRENPLYVGVEHNFFLDETEVVRADLVEGIGGFSIQVQFTRHGTFVLDQVTSGNRGKRIAVFTIADEARWLAAPEITHRIASGVFTFTPDATREEAERIVRGLNNVAEIVRKRNRF